MGNKAVAHFLNGRVLKGACYDVAPERSVCHVTTPDAVTETVALADLKALFFVKDLAGDPLYQDSQTLDPGDLRAWGARQVEVRFRDGEWLVGLAPTYQPQRQFFFVIPVDAKSNNVRVLVNRAATQSVNLL